MKKTRASGSGIGMYIPQEYDEEVAKILAIYCHHLTVATFESVQETALDLDEKSKETEKQVSLSTFASILDKVITHIKEQAQELEELEEEREING